jgi:hypothetical protein
MRKQANQKRKLDALENPMFRPNPQPGFSYDNSNTSKFANEWSLRQLQDSIELLKQSGIDFATTEARGVDVRHFGELLMSSGIVLNDDVRWITFHSGYDFGYLLKVFFVGFVAILLRRACCDYHHQQIRTPPHHQNWKVLTCQPLPDGEPDTGHPHAFIGAADQGVIYRAGTWHGPLVALDTAGDFLMQMRECGGPLDCEERPLAIPLLITE